MSLEKQVSFTVTNTYSTLNTYSDRTKNIWLVFHGMGYLSKYFINYFSSLNTEENFIIAPQAPSKYYYGKNFKYVGASWLTRENTREDTKNCLTYIDAIFDVEHLDENLNFIVLGYSQGVSVALRWLSSRKIQCHHLVIHSGGIPVELSTDDFSYMDEKTKVTYICGDSDQYISKDSRNEQHAMGKALFGARFFTITFKGGHEVHTSVLADII